MNNNLISVDLDEYTRSAFAEDFFATRYVPVITGDDNARPKDYRYKNIEGEFLVGDTLFEVKSDWGKAAYTQNVVLETENDKFPDRLGWYQHCFQNGVDRVVWFCYRKTWDGQNYQPEPFCAVDVPVEDIDSLLQRDEDKRRLPRRRFQDTGIILLPLRTLDKECRTQFYVHTIKPNTSPREAMEMAGGVSDVEEFISRLKEAG